jgi:7-cyano-7-deazaguanine synthase
MSTAILLSGGMDSVAIAFWKRPELAVTIDYGQRPAAAEMRAASAVADALGIKHLKVTVPAGELGSGDLAGSPPLSLAAKPEWWPYRNQLLVTIAAAKVLPLGARKLLIGTLAADSDDCGQGFRLNAATRSDRRRPPVPTKAAGVWLPAW